MTAHDHTERVPGCYRCDLSRDEVTADVNVTEKMARAMWREEYRYIDVDWDSNADTYRAHAQALLAELADPDVLAGIAGVLRGHGWVYTQPATATRCVCGKRWAATSYDVDGDMAAHQAAAVVEWLRGRAL